MKDQEVSEEVPHRYPQSGQKCIQRGSVLLLSFAASIHCEYIGKIGCNSDAGKYVLQLEKGPLKHALNSCLFYSVV